MRLLVLLALAAPCWGAWANGYAYRYTDAVYSAKVGGASHTGFPAWRCVTDAHLAHTTHSGYATDLNGYDIIPTSDEAGSALLPFDRRDYNHETGKWCGFTKTDASHTASTPVYFWVGNASVTTDQQNITGTWDANFVGVWHLDDNAASTTVLDSTSYARNLTMQLSVNTSAVSAVGKVGNGFTFVRASGHRAFGANSSDYGCTNGLVEIWVNVTAAYAGGVVSRNHGGAGPGGWWIYGHDAASSFYGTVWVGYTAYPSETAAKSAGWHHVALRTSGGNLTQVFLDGVLSGTTTAHIPDSSSSLLALGTRTDEYYPDSLNGSADELRVSKDPRSAAWILATYNNQFDPATFWVGGGSWASGPSGDHRRRKPVIQ